MTCEELIHALKQMPGHYTVQAFHDGAEVADFTATITFVERQPDFKLVDLVIDLPQTEEKLLEERRKLKGEIEDLKDEAADLRGDVRRLQRSLNELLDELEKKSVTA